MAYYITSGIQSCFEAEPDRLSGNCHSEASAEESRSLTDCYYEILRFTQNDKINILQILGQLAEMCRRHCVSDYLGKYEKARVVHL